MSVFDFAEIKDPIILKYKNTQISLPVTLCTASQAKKIIKTEIPGKDGTVKEYIGMDDYNVQINGILTAANGQSPMDQVITLKRILDAKDPINPIEVINKYLNDLDIFCLVIVDYTLDQKPGGYSKQDFTINAISETPIILQLS